MATNLNQTPENVEKPQFTELDWITLKKDINSAEFENVETSREKFMRKFNENPLVPIGCGLTATVLTVGLWSFSKGRKQMSQTMMRARIAAQGLTIAALMLGIVKSSMSK